MKFVDEVEISVVAGNGGNGCVSFRREKFVPKGGPDGGDGGKGGSVYIIANKQFSTLSDLRYKKIITAGNGESGKGKDKYGKKGKDIYINVPVGTIVRSRNNPNVFYDLTENGEKIEIAKGGAGGKGNKHFASSTNRTPFYAGEGEEGESDDLLLELKLLADVGLIGLPNAGKSTFISVVSNARPKISDYPFTTLTPNLGVVDIGIKKSFVIADIPGLIEGAHTGKGLGIQFLKHIERTKILLHLLDATISDSDILLESYSKIRYELEKFNKELLKKDEVLCLSKIDAIDKDKATKIKKELEKKINKRIFLISSVTKYGMDKVVSFLSNKLF